MEDDTLYNSSFNSGVLSLTAQDTLSGMREVVFPALFGTAVYTVTDVPFEKSYPIEPSATLSGTFTVTAYDRVGNRSDSTPFTILKDSTPPDLVLNVPGDSGLILPVSWAGSDDLSGVAGYDVQVRTGEGAWTDWLTGTQRTEAEFVGSEGVSYSFQVRASDRVGNTSAWTTSSPSSVQGVTKYYYFKGQRVALRRGTGSGSKVYYLHGDHLGSTSLVTDGAGSTVSESRYAPFGEVRWTRGASLTDFSFTGQRRDGFGLLDYHARYYSPALGRFIQADTIVPDVWNSQSWDRFRYVSNNPLRYTDPTGHCDDGDGDGKCDPREKKGPFNSEIPTGITDPERRNNPTDSYPNGFIQPSWESYKKVRNWLNSNVYLSSTVDATGKIDDEVLMALLILGEFYGFRKYDEGSTEKIAYHESLEALSNQYDAEYGVGGNFSNIQCGGNCTIQEQLMWLSDMAGWYSGQSAQNAIKIGIMSFMGDANAAANNYHYGADTKWNWGNTNNPSMYGDAITADSQDPNFLYYVVYGYTIR